MFLICAVFVTVEHSCLCCNFFPFLFLFLCYEVWWIKDRYNWQLWLRETEQKALCVLAFEFSCHMHLYSSVALCQSSALPRVRRLDTLTHKSNTLPRATHRPLSTSGFSTPNVSPKRSPQSLPRKHSQPCLHQQPGCREVGLISSI